MPLSDIVNALLLFVGALALTVSARANRLAAQAADYESHLAFAERYSNAWRRFRDSETDDERFFEFAELMNLIECTCHLYNRASLGTTTKEMLRDYLTEILPSIFQDSYANDAIRSALTNPDTFFHLRRFARNHKVRGVPHQ